MTYIEQINPFGRSMSGFDPSGRSVFGKEFVTLQNIIDNNGNTRNPLYIADSYLNLPTNIKAALTDVYGTPGKEPGFQIYAVIPMEVSYPSPYLVMPGDKLSLAVSKMRPAVRNDGQQLPRFGGGQISIFDDSPHVNSGGHDVSFCSGSIKMTIYGTVLSEGIEHNDTLNQSCNTDAIHEMIGAEPIIDQFEVEYRGLYYGGMNDNYITGSMLTKQMNENGKLTFIQGNRARVCSKFLAAMQSTHDADPSYSFCLQPWSERVGSTRISQAMSDGERFYDSMLPALDKCFKVNGSSIIKNSLQWNPSHTKDIKVAGTGLILLDQQSQSPGLPIDNDWMWSYPFEAKYSSIARQLNIEKSFVTDVNWNGTIVTKIDPVTVNGIYVGLFGYIESAPLTSDSFYTYADINLSINKVIPMSNNDTIKTLFGFGDQNIIFIRDDGTREGNNHLRAFRTIPSYMDYGEFYWLVSPVIRGWKYGVYSGFPTYSQAIYRNGHYGQLRDMLEQRPYTKYYQYKSTIIDDTKEGVLAGPVTIQFIDSAGMQTPPENTWSHNLSYEATSSMPYFEGESRNRPVINNNLLNKNVVAFKSDVFKNLTL